MTIDTNPRRRQLLGWTVAAVAAPLAVTLGATQGDAATPREIVIRARRFVFTPDKIALKAGEPVVLVLIAEDVVMGLSAPDLGVRADMPPGRTVRVPLTPARPGTYGFLCDIFCGSGHENMSGTFVVTA
ncbi:cupredoxin domain-containing protein [Cupriavidus sp. Marseille-Q8015]